MSLTQYCQLLTVGATNEDGLDFPEVICRLTGDRCVGYNAPEENPRENIGTLDLEPITHCPANSLGTLLGAAIKALYLENREEYKTLIGQLRGYGR